MALTHNHTTTRTRVRPAEIYRIVSQKQLDQHDNNPTPSSNTHILQVPPTLEPETTKKGCC
jgi:hypothetical protein